MKKNATYEEADMRAKANTMHMQPPKRLTILSRLRTIIHERWCAFKIKDNEADLQQLIDSLEKHHRTVFETTGNATIIIEEDTSISLVNQDFERLSGYSKEEIEGKMSWTLFIDKADLGKMMQYHRLRRIDPNAAPRNYYFKFIDRHGSTKDIYMTIAMIPGTKKSIASFKDISEQRRLEIEALEIAERERRTIGSDLHDGLGPHLVGIKFMLSLLKQKLASRKIPETENIDEIIRYIDQAVEKTRHLVKNLCPVDIDASGLEHALGELAAETMRLFGITCTVSFDGNAGIRDNTSATQLYFIAREAVNNAVKHSGAKHISISMERSTNSRIFSVKDDGEGISAWSRISGSGINIMKYRARLINALLDVLPGDNGGTNVVCVFQENSADEDSSNG